MTVNQGSIISIRGSVVDVHFLEHLPEPNNLLKTGTNQQVALEVVTYLSSKIVRTIALTPTQGLARGSTVIDTGHSLQVPLENANLGRMFNVFGETIDGRSPLPHCPSSQTNPSQLRRTQRYHRHVGTRRTGTERT